VKINWIEHKQSQYKTAMAIIVEFMSQSPIELWLPEKANLTTKDYTLHQFQCYVWRKIDEYNLYNNRYKWQYQNRKPYKKD
jgi:predicted KAP-like P-loop ATPase